MPTDKSDRRGEILNAAGAEFMEKGYAAATTLGLARRARISKRDLYALFGSKQGVLEALIGDYTAAMTLAPLAPPRKADDFLETLETFGRAFLGQILDEKRVMFYRLAISEAPRSDFARILRTRGIEPVTRSITAFFTQAVLAGIITAGDAPLIADVFIGVLLGQTQIDMLLGLAEAPGPAEIALRASRAREAAHRIFQGGRAA